VELGIETAKGDWCGGHTKSGDEGVVVLAQTGKDVGHKLAILKGVTGSN
jgi:hypothetical protein